MKTTRKLLCVLLIAFLALGSIGMTFAAELTPATNPNAPEGTMVVSAPAPGQLVVSPSPQQIWVDMTPKPVQAYNIGGYNYFRIRDIANMMSGTYKQFNVVYQVESNTVAVEIRKPYVWQEGDMQVASGDKVATKTSQSVTFDNYPASFDVYNIDGNNYFRIRDIASKVNFGVSYDEASNIVYVNSQSDYQAPATGTL